MTEANRFSSVVSHNEPSKHTFECSQFGKFENKRQFTRYDWLSLKVGRGRGTWEAGTWGRGDLGTRGRGDAGTRGRKTKILYTSPLGSLSFR